MAIHLNVATDAYVSWNIVFGILSLQPVPVLSLFRLFYLICVKHVLLKLHPHATAGSGTKLNTTPATTNNTLTNYNY